MNITDTVTNATQCTLGSALQWGSERLRGSTTARRDAESLLMRAADCDRTVLLAHPDRPLTLGQGTVYRNLLARRAAHEPVQYILGEQEFFGLRFEVTPAVLIPRPETEHLVEALLARIPSEKSVRIADLGTGSGAIAVALASKLPNARITALDISPAALSVARKNAQQHNVSNRIHFMESDLLAAIDPGTRFDAIVSNPPYVAYAEQLEAQVHDYEPHTALFAGLTGLEIYERLIPQAAKLLVPGGWLMLEIGAGQQSPVQELLSGWDGVCFVADLQAIPRVAIARRVGGH